MAYCILKMDRIKSENILKQTGDHHFRFTHPLNADPNIEALNDEAIPLKGESILDDWNARISKSEYYKDKKPRTGQILAYDILVSYSPEASEWIDVDAWKKDNEQWLKDTFGEENVLSLVYHYDEASAKETGTIHGHAIVVPMNEEGKLVGSELIETHERRVAFQDSYAEAMSVHGLNRAIEGSKDFGEPIKHFYARVKDAVDQPIPEKSEHESWEQYSERLKNAYREERANHIKENETLKDQIQEKKLEAKESVLKEELNRLNKEYEQILSEEREMIHEFGGWEAAAEKADEMQNLNDAIDLYSDEEKADELAENISMLLEWERGRKKEKEKGTEF